MKKTVGFGDSITNGFLVDKGYLDYLQNRFANLISIVNSGIPGDTVIDAWHRLEYSVLKHKPDITIVEFALNDAFSNIPVPRFKEYFLKIIENIPNYKIIVIPHLTEDTFLIKTAKPYYEVLRTVSYSNNIPLADLSKYRFSSNELLSDNIHPNENGYKIYADEISTVLESVINEC